jgi:hypothetical protein
MPPETKAPTPESWLLFVQDSITDARDRDFTADLVLCVVT